MKLQKHIISLTFLAVGLSGCAQNLYVKKTNNPFDLRLYGFYDNKIQDGVYKVGYTGGSQENAEDLVLLRAADVTLDNGFRFFVIQDLANNQKTLSSYTSLIPYNHNGKTYYAGGYTTTTQMPEVSRIINCFKDKPREASSLVYDAQEVRINLRAKYHLDKEKNLDTRKFSAEKMMLAPEVTGIEPDNVTAEKKLSVVVDDKKAVENAFDKALSK